jgi:hypothetical protein
MRCKDHDLWICGQGSRRHILYQGYSTFTWRDWEHIWIDGIRAETRTECLWEISQLRQTTQLVSSKGSKHINTGCSDLSGTPFKTLAKAETLFLLYYRCFTARERWTCYKVSRVRIPEQFFTCFPQFRFRQTLIWRENKEANVYFQNPGLCYAVL